MTLSPDMSSGSRPGPGAVAQALRLGLVPVGVAALFSLVSNLLYLALPIYTNQVFSRVLASQSGGTLAVLSGGTLFVFFVSALIDHYRTQLLAGFGIVFDRRLASRTFAALFDAAASQPGVRAQALRDLDTVRQTIAGSAINMLFDLPWIPLFLLVLFLIDASIGLVTTIGAVVLVILAVLQDRATRAAMKRASDAAIRSYGQTDAGLRNAEVVRALGMLPTLTRRWARLRHRAVEEGVAATHRGAVYAGAIRFVRTSIQVLTIAIGAWLVIGRVIPAALLFANMILASRALAPLDRVVSSWNVLFEGLQSYRRLEALLLGYEPPAHATRLPAVDGRVTIEGVIFVPPGARTPTLAGLSLVIEAGEFVGLVGPSGAGKSTLARLIVGIWKPSAGVVRLDGADVHGWNREDFGRQVAYQPQDTELFAGTVRDNIARFRDDATDEQVVAAARIAGAHDVILRLPDGYETELGEGGAVLSSGQRQRVGLARTLFGEPRLIVLDEPNAHLDSEGETMLMRALMAMKARGGTIVLISHKPAAFIHADRIALLGHGRITEHGPRDTMLARLSGAAPPSRTSLAEAAS